MPGRGGQALTQASVACSATRRLRLRDNARAFPGSAMPSPVST
jgi:hypothetical protein